MKLLNFGVMLLFFNISKVGAQTEIDSITYTIGDVHVGIRSMGNEIPLELTGTNTQIISSKEIEKLPVQTTSELLSYVIGVDLRQRGASGVQADLGIQGSGFDQVLVLINGVRMSDAQTGHHMLNLPIPIEAIDRVEVIKGANARRYGLNAMAGVVNFITKKSQESTIVINSFDGTSFEKDKGGSTYLNLGHRIYATANRGKANAWFSSSYDNGNGYRNNSAYTTYRNIGELTVPLKKIDLNALIGSINNDFGANGFYAAPGDSNSKETVNTYFGNLRATYNLSQKQKLRANIGLRNNFDHYIYRRNNPSFSQNKHTSEVLMADLNWQNQLYDWNLAIGVEGRKESIQSTNLKNHNRDFLGAYFDLNRQWNRFFISGGLYALQNEILGLKFYPGIEASYKIKNEMTAFGNFGTGQRLPTFTDLYYKGPTNKSNPNLKPESASSFEVGMRYQNEKLKVSGSVFQRNTNQLIDWTRISLDSAWSPINYNTNIVNGFELNASYSYRKLLFFVNYCGLDIQSSKENNVISKNALNYLSNQAIAGVFFPIVKNLNVSLQARYIQRNATNGNYWLYSAKFDYRIKKQINVYLNIQNITNEEYSEVNILPLPPRWISFGSTIRLN